MEIKFLFVMFVYYVGAVFGESVDYSPPVSIQNMDESILRSRGSNENEMKNEAGGITTLESKNDEVDSFQSNKANEIDIDQIFANNLELNNLLLGIKKDSTLESPTHTKGRRFQNEMDFQKTLVFQIEENDRFVDSDIDIFATLTLPFSTFEGHKIDYFIISTPPSYTLPKAGKLCKCVKHLEEISPEIMKPVPISIKCTTVSANGSIYFVIQNKDESALPAPGYYRFQLKVRTPVETRKVQNDPKNFWWLSKIRFSSGHYITKVHENTRLLLKAECQWSPWRRETGCSSTCDSGVEMWRRTLLSGKNEELCGGAYQKRECGDTPCNVSCQLGPWEELVPCTVSCNASKNGGKRIEYRKILLTNSGNGPDCEKLYPWDKEKQMGWNESLGMVIKYSECPLEMRQDCKKEFGCRVERENLRTIASEYPWGFCPFPCGGFGNITSIVQVANGIPRWIGEKLYPKTFEYPCISNKKPIVEYKPCNKNPCGDCMVYLEDSELNKTTNIWVFFHLFQEADEIRFVLPDGFTFLKSNDNELIHNIAHDKNLKFDNNTKIITSINKAIKVNQTNYIDIIKQSFNRIIFGDVSPSTDTSGSKNDENNNSNNNNINNNINNNNNTHNITKCQVTAASFGSIKTCQLINHHSKSNYMIENYKEALVILDSTVQPTRSIFSEQSKNEKPNWLFMPLKIGNAEGLVLPNGRLNNEQFRLYARGSNSLKEPEELVCNLQTKVLLPQPCRVDLLPKNGKDCIKCSKTNVFIIEAYRQFTSPKNGGACTVPSELRVDETIINVECINACPNGRRYVMGTDKYLKKIGINS
ncbi:TSP1 domain-containing protein TSP12 precursor [Cryptosporidium ubiquitum]|uniref:TSP1 domain-containing protein TSP12 n=1 Tax=Cryptosporidium ubiquitum TaxID=857276 RepID=A0A1J4MDM7_9CRYT|nr:TSP1 domain-containing protein TSP12 precursor [Cryptosporidium ubiquitum]OII70981.1 TSP1 domain-containing protein TSP12 precursor [Cryptosporidium ubiquitum]